MDEDRLLLVVVADNQHAMADIRDLVEGAGHRAGAFVFHEAFVERRAVTKRTAGGDDRLDRVEIAGFDDGPVGNLEAAIGGGVGIVARPELGAVRIIGGGLPVRRSALLEQIEVGCKPRSRTALLPVALHDFDIDMGWACLQRRARWGLARRCGRRVGGEPIGRSPGGATPGTADMAWRPLRLRRREILWVDGGRGRQRRRHRRPDERAILSDGGIIAEIENCFMHGHGGLLSAAPAA
ncbi:hypothetical protein D9M72_365470 [compost metagenome]